MKQLISVILVITTMLSVSGCNIIVENTDNSSSTVSETETPTQSNKEEQKRFSVIFDPNEQFADEESRLASERIDPVIQKAVNILNTIPQKNIEVLPWEQNEHPSEKEKLAGDEVALKWYDFIYEKMSKMESFRLDPADYGEEEELYLPFYTAETALYVDHRELFMCGATWAGEDGIIYPIYFMPGDSFDKPCEDKAAIKKAVEVYYRVVDRIFEKMPQGLTGYEKTFYFILVICMSTNYQLARLETVFSPYDTLVLGHTVCNGYARTFVELCKRAGISAWYLSGRAPSGEFHGWNMIDTTNGPLYLDITWYDNNDIVDQYWQGCEEYLFMTQKEYDNFGYVHGLSPEETEPF